VMESDGESERLSPVVVGRENENDLVDVWLYEFVWNWG